MSGRLGFALLSAFVLAGTAFAGPPHPGDPQKRYNAADQAWAQAIRIQRADLGAGDWRVEPPTAKGAPRGCKDPDLSDLVETGEAQEPDFSRNGSFVGSGAAIFQTERQAATAWSRVSGQPVARCLIDAFKKGLGGSGVKLSILFNGPAATEKLAPRFTSSQIRLALSGPGGKIQGRISYYLYGRGRATAALMIASFGRPLQPIPASVEHRLAGLVAARLHR